MSEPMQTHYVGCWRDPGHHACAIGQVEALLEAGKALKKEVKEARTTAREVAQGVPEDIEALAFELGIDPTNFPHWVSEYDYTYAWIKEALLSTKARGKIGRPTAYVQGICARYHEQGGSDHELRPERGQAPVRETYLDRW